MYRSQLLTYLSALFSSGNPSASDFQKLIQGLGSESDRPHIVCVSSASNIPDDQLLTSTYDMPTTTSGSGCGSTGVSPVPSGCGCPPAPTPPTPPLPTTRKEKVINVLCDWFREGWLLDCIGICTGTDAARAYYWVVSMDSDAGTYEILSVQFNNPGFGKGGFASENAIRLLRLVYNRSTQTVVSTDARLVITELTNAVMSEDVREIKIVYSTPPMQEDGVLYVQMSLPKLDKPDVSVSAVTQTSCVLSWPSIAGAAGYRFAIEGTDISAIVSSPYMVTNLKPSRSYVFTVTALGDGVKSSDSEASSVNVLTPAASILSAPVPVVSNLSSTSAVVSWSAARGGDSYTYRLNNGPLVSEVMPPVTLDGLTPGFRYTFAVKAISTSPAVLDSDWGSTDFVTESGD